MRINEETKNYLNHALNEARIAGFELDKSLKKVSVVFETIAMNNDGSIPEDTRVIFHFINVSRIASQLKLGKWNNETAEILKFQPEELTNHIADLSGQPMYGWKFINVQDSELKFEKWEDKASFDLKLFKATETPNTIDIFSEEFGETPKTLDLRIWFDDFEIESILGIPMTVQEFIERGVKGWNAIYEGNDTMIHKHGIVALAEESNTDSNNNLNPIDKQIEEGNTFTELNFWSKLKQWFS